jgi:mono/diheme cytochrome c family protein
VYSRNISPDLETGIGRWTDAQIVNAIRRGERPDGTRLFPIHPYTYFAHIADDEAFALAAYMKSVKPNSHRVPASALKGPVPAIAVPAGPKASPLTGLDRGEYLVNGPAHCGDCHTPRRPDGSQDMSKFLAGGPGPEGTLPSNITPHPETGIGRWTEDQIARFLRTGVKPNGQSATSLMRVVIQGTFGGYKDMTLADALAIARYLKTVTAIDNKVP